MNIEQLKEELGNLEDALLSVSGSDLEDVKSYADEIHDQSYAMQCSADDVISSVDSVQSDINTLKGQLDELEGFNIDTVREEVAKEITFKLTNKFEQFIKDVLASDLEPAKQALKEPARKTSSSDES